MRKLTRCERSARLLLSLFFAAILLFLSVGAQPVLSVTLAGQVPFRLEGDLVQAEASAALVVGPQSDISCPVGAVDLPRGTDIQRVVDAYPGGTAFCLKAGVHAITGAITPKTGDVFVGEYGAILDGTRWTTADQTQAAFRAHNQDIDDVTIRNLVIQHMPQRGIHAFPWMSDRWIVEYTEITGGQVGIQVGNQSVVRHSWIHHNVGNPFSPIPVERGGGYSVYQSTDVLFEHNEISYNGPEQKVSLSTNVTFRDNFVHHNRWDGIWYDGDNVGSLIEGNRVEDHPGSAIFYEISGRGVIRNNVVRRSGEHGVFISTSKEVEIYNNQSRGQLPRHSVLRRLRRGWRRRDRLGSREQYRSR